MTIEVYDELVNLRSMKAGRIPLTLKVKAALSLAQATTQLRGPVIPPEQRVVICDVSKYNCLVEQGKYVDFVKMKYAGAEGVIIRASLGTAYPDPAYQVLCELASGILPTGAYHGLTVGDGASQGLNFCNQVGNKPNPLKLWIDVELQSVAASILRACVQYVYDVYQEWPGIYSSVNYWPKVIGEYDKRWIEERCPLWVAHWDTWSPLIPYNWLDRLMHQYKGDNNGLGRMYGSPNGAEPDMDVSCIARDKYNELVHPPLSLEQRVKRLEEAVFPEDIPSL